MAEVETSWFAGLGNRISGWVADVIGHPYAQIGVVAICALWWTIGLPTDILTAGLSILAITLTQMVLNRQGEREIDVHRRDIAMHAKLDELVFTSKRARNSLVGIEDGMEEQEIETLKEEVREALADEAETPPAAGPPPLVQT